MTNSKNHQIDQLIKQLTEIEENISNDKNYAVDFYAQKGKSALMYFINDWKEPTDPKQWFVCSLIKNKAFNYDSFRTLLYWIFKTLFALFQKCNISWDSTEVDVSIVQLVFN